MSNPNERTAAQQSLTPEVIDLLAAVHGALAPVGLDHAGMIHRMVEVQVRLEGILASAAIDAEHPEWPALVSRTIADAITALRRD